MISEGLDVFHGYESHFKDHKLSPGETYFIPLVSDLKKNLLILCICRIFFVIYNMSLILAQREISNRWYHNIESVLTINFFQNRLNIIIPFI